MISKENYVNIQGWMRTELSLKGNELIIYACIYGFSQDGESWFTGSAQYLADWCGISRQATMEILKGLIDKTYIQKKVIEKNGVRLCNYKHTDRLQGVKKYDRGCQERLQGGCQERLHHTISSYSKETIETKKENPYKEIYDVYIVSYKELFGKEPIIMYSAMTKRIKTLLIDITKEQIINAIIFAKKDNFCVNTTKYQLQTILSEKVLPRLINASIQNSYSSSSPNIYNGAGRTMAKTCPECGSELDNYLTCPKCKIEYDVSGKAIK